MTGWRWIGVALIAAALRLPKLDIRPMHGDEAVLAVKAGAMMWGGEGASYDPQGYHGTLLGWLTWPVLKISGAKSLADTDERHFRLVTALCGILLCLTPILLADGLGTNGALIAGLLLAVSPAFVYWSRFYIQEVPLVLATSLALGCGWRFARSKRTGWLWGAGISAGLMLCLKETAWLSFIAGGMGLAVVTPARNWIGKHWSHLVWPAAAALAIPALILGPSALLAPAHYWHLGLTGGDHAHSWHWYFTAILGPWKGSPEWIPLLFAVAATVRVIRGRRVMACSRDLGVFLVVLAYAETFEYSVLSYKTPWCVLNILLGGSMLAAIECEEMERDRHRQIRSGSLERTSRWQSVALLMLVVLTQTYAAWDWSCRNPAGRRNPLVYAQPAEDVRRLGNLVRKISSVYPKGRDMIITVSAENPWPLPWELRGFPNVGYWKPGDPESKSAFKVAAVRISPATPTSRGMMFGLRPGEILLVETDRKLLDGALRQK